MVALGTVGLVLEVAVMIEGELTTLVLPHPARKDAINKKITFCQQCLDSII